MPRTCARPNSARLNASTSTMAVGTSSDRRRSSRPSSQPPPNPSAAPPIISRREQQRGVDPGGRGRLDDDADDEDGEEDRHRVVEARFDFQQRVDPLGQGEAGAAEQRGNRGSVGRCDRGADQHGHREGHGGDPHDRRGDDGGGDADTDHRQGERRPDREAQHRGMRLEAALEQDHRERHAADQVGGGEVVVLDAARSILAGQHAEYQEHQQHRCAEAAGQQAGEHAQHTERRTDEDHLVGERPCGRGRGPAGRVRWAFRSGCSPVVTGRAMAAMALTPVAARLN